MKHPIRNTLLTLTAVFFFLLRPALAENITDMAGRTVAVPENITRVYGTSPPATNLIYAVSPEKLACLNIPVRESEKKFIDPAILKLPVAGGWFGQGRTPNMENIIAVRPDVILFWKFSNSMKNADVEAALKHMNIPLVFVVMDRVTDYPKVFRFMGKLLGKEERAETLARYAEKTVSDMETVRAAVPEENRLTVYYAENANGLSTECDASFHAELIPLCGGVNVHKCITRDNYGMDKISMEQVLLYDPQVIVTHSLPFYRGLFTDTRWRSIRAVKDKRIYLIPTAPMNWFDRPPSFMRLIGARWLAHALYPDVYPLDLDAETRTFYTLFLGHPLTRDELREVLAP